MHNGKTILAIIPARGGSKGLPRKNIKLFAGKPLIAWSIEAAKGCAYIDKVIVSTEDAEIATVARRSGAEVPFSRPAELATDQAASIDVILHALEHFEQQGEEYDILIVLQPTSPLRTPVDIDNALKLLFLAQACSVVSVCAAEHNPLWANTLPPDGSMKDFLRPEILNKNRQEIGKYYRLNGAIYIAYTNYLKKNKGFIGQDAFAYIMPPERSADIDTELDLRLAEFIKRKILG